MSDTEFVTEIANENGSVATAAESEEQQTTTREAKMSNSQLDNGIGSLEPREERSMTQDMIEKAKAGDRSVIDQLLYNTYDSFNESYEHYADEIVPSDRKSSEAFESLTMDMSSGYLRAIPTVLTESDLSQFVYMRDCRAGKPEAIAKLIRHAQETEELNRILRSRSDLVPLEERERYKREHNGRPLVTDTRATEAILDRLGIAYEKEPPRTWIPPTKEEITAEKRELRRLRKLAKTLLWAATLLDQQRKLAKTASGPQRASQPR